MTTETSPLRSLALTTLTALVATLGACGGGGGDDGPDPIDKYMGDFIGSCQVAVGATDANTGAAIYSSTSRDLTTKISATQATGTVQIAYFGANDCSGAVRATVTLSTTDNFLNVDGNELLAGQPVDKVTVGTGVYFPGIHAGGSITLNDITFTGAPYTNSSPLTTKDIETVDMGGRLYVGDDSQPLDDQGYPSALDATPVAQRS